jgi:hypothetical protein
LLFLSNERSVEFLLPTWSKSRHELKCCSKYFLDNFFFPLRNEQDVSEKAGKYGENFSPTLTFYAHFSHLCNLCCIFRSFLSLSPHFCFNPHKITPELEKISSHNFWLWSNSMLLLQVEKKKDKFLTSVTLSNNFVSSSWSEKR